MKELFIDEGMLNYLFEIESKKLVGTCLKRLEIPVEIKKKMNKELNLNSEEIENLKSQIKNLLYEWSRDLRDLIIINSKTSDAVHLTKKEK